MPTASVPSESVFPESVRNAGRIKEFTAAVPFPTRIWERVEEPVPPYVAPTMEPFHVPEETVPR